MKIPDKLPIAQMCRRLDAISAVIHEMIDGKRPTAPTFSCPNCGTTGTLSAKPVGNSLALKYKCDCMTVTIQHAARWPGHEILPIESGQVGI